MAMIWASCGRESRREGGREGGMCVAVIPRFLVSLSLLALTDGGKSEEGRMRGGKEGHTHGGRVKTVERRRKEAI
jgi:hypothetical protein